MKTFSLTKQIIAIVIGCQLLLTAGLTVAAVAYGRTQLLDAFDTELHGRAMSTLALVRYTETHPPALIFDAEFLPPSSDPVHKDVFKVTGQEGGALGQSEVKLPAEIERISAGNADFSLQDVPYRAVVLRSVLVLDEEEDSDEIPARVTVIYAASLLGMHRELLRLGISVAGTSLLLLTLVSGIAAWLVRRKLKPLHELAARAGDISIHNWDFHPPPSARTLPELAPLTETIENVLARLRKSFQQQRDFTSDAAHELKTSVAIIKSTTQSLLHQRRTATEYCAGLEGLLEDCGRLEDLVERMLRLARIEQWTQDETPRNMTVTELVSTCEVAISRIGKLAGTRDVVLELIPTSPPAVHVRADPQDLEMIWVNLLENAVQYSPASSRVALRIEPNSGRTAVISVEDCGPGILVEELPHIFGRFRRGDLSRARSTGGFGLGLAICKALVTAYGGQIEAFNRPSGGTIMRVTLPTEG